MLTRDLKNEYQGSTKKSLQSPVIETNEFFTNQIFTHLFQIIVSVIKDASGDDIPGGGKPLQSPPAGHKSVPAYIQDDTFPLTSLPTLLSLHCSSNSSTVKKIAKS